MDKTAHEVRPQQWYETIQVFTIYEITKRALQISSFCNALCDSVFSRHFLHPFPRY